MRTLITLLLALSFAPRPARAQLSPEARTGIEAFNRALESATRTMSTGATLALWADDGITLLPSAKPIVGKAAITTFLDDVMGSLAGAKMQSFEMQCFDIVAAGDWASEWCTEHQVVELGGGKPPFDGRGKLLLVLRRAADGRWLIEREMWNQGEPSRG